MIGGWKEIMLDKEELRSVYGKLLIEMAEQDERIVVLDADLMRANGVLPFKEAYPERAFDVGVAEANMMGIAAGLSNEGFIPFAGTFTPFASRRSFDQVFLSIAYAGLNVKIVGTDPGIAAELNGGTHMCTEDVALMRTIPNMTVVEPPDSAALKSLLPQVAKAYGSAYIRLFRKKADQVYEEGVKLELGKAQILREGSDGSIFCTGMMVKPSLDAADLLTAKGIRTRVVNIHTIKPLDEEAVAAAAKETGAIVSAENHNVVNGLGTAIADVLAEHYPAPLKKIGLQDHFGEVGTRDYLMEKFGMSPKHIAKAVEHVLK